VCTLAVGAPLPGDGPRPRSEVTAGATGSGQCLMLAKAGDSELP
jgi:hypothetical protein